MTKQQEIIEILNKYQINDVKLQIPNSTEISLSGDLLKFVKKQIKDSKKTRTANTAKSRKAKGVKLENYIANQITKELKVEAKKMPKSGQYQGFKSDIFTKLPVSIEAKNHESWKIHEWWKQCEHDAILNKNIPMLVMSRNNLKDPKVVFNFGDVLTIMKYALAGGWK